MKKVLFIMIFLLILGGSVFFLGWAQLTVPPGSYGVMRSKTHGLEPEVISGGKFRWMWYKAIPANAAVSVFTVTPVRRIINSGGDLSSGRLYAALAGLDADFSWEITGEFSFSLRPEYLPELSARENITSDAGLREAERDLAARIENPLLQRLKSRIETGYEKTMEEIALGGSVAGLDAEIAALFPEIVNFRSSIRTLRYPDYALYESVKGLYRDYLARQNEVLRQDIVKEAETRIDTRMRVDELTRYGELLTKYPVLIQYLALEKGIAPAGPGPETTDGESNP